MKIFDAFATERGRTGYAKYRCDFAKLIWQLASPEWSFDDVSAKAFAAADGYARATAPAPPAASRAGR